MYRSFILLGSLGAGLASFKFRKFKVSQIANHEASRDPNMGGNILNDISLAIIGYFSFHLLSCDYIYKHR